MRFIALAGVACILTVLCGVVASKTTTSVSVHRCGSKWCASKLARPPLHGGPVQGAAHATYSAMDNVTGWNILNVSTNPSFSDEDQAYAAGFAEGAVSYNDIVSAIANSIVPPTPQLVEFMQANFDWMQQQVAANRHEPYWRQVNLTLLQFHGILDGANSVAPPGGEVTLFNLWTQAADGDLIDLVPALNITSSSREDWASMAKDDFNAWFIKRTHCSALVKLALDLSDVYFGHATWSTYNDMLRVYKHYFLSFKGVAAKEVSFSSYPGTPVSIDDFYVTGAGLAVTETTLNVFNYSIYNGNVVPQTLLYWVRASVTNRLASSSVAWVEMFGRYNSGTYNNQWIVLDMKKFRPGQDLPDGSLYISEQMPGMYVIKDETPTLRLGYWPSYNVPSVPAVFEYAGYPAAVQQQGWEMLDYQRCVRAQIFRRDQANVSDMPSMQLLMQYNDYLNDPLSMGNPVYAIASRGDLGPAPQCFGAIDAKVTSWYMYSTGRQVLAFSGPTPQQGIFSFSDLPAGTPMCQHQGAPQTFDFLWKTMAPYEDNN